MNEQLSVIFVSLGNPNHTWTMQNKVRTEADINNGQTMIQAAKLFRKDRGFHGNQAEQLMVRDLSDS